MEIEDEMLIINVSCSKLGVICLVVVISIVPALSLGKHNKNIIKHSQNVTSNIVPESFPKRNSNIAKYKTAKGLKGRSEINLINETNLGERDVTNGNSIQQNGSNIVKKSPKLDEETHITDQGKSGGNSTGTVRVSPTGRTASYEVVKQFDLPSIAAIFKSNRGYHSFCTGSIITNEHVIMSSSCISEFNSTNITNASLYTIAAGIIDLSDETLIQWRSVVLVKLNEAEDEHNNVADLAIMQVSAPFYINKRLSPVPISIIKFEGERICDLVGWDLPGSTTKGKSFEIVKKVKISLMDGQKCTDKNAICGLPLNIKNESIVVESKLSQVVCGNELVGLRRFSDIQASTSASDPIIVTDIGGCYDFTKAYEINLKVDPPTSKAASLPEIPYGSGISAFIFWTVYGIYVLS